MDAVEYMKAAKRLCRSKSGCEECPLCPFWGCDVPAMYSSEEAIVAIVEVWAEAHPEEEQDERS